MFKNAVKNILEELDPKGDLKPAASVYDSPNIKVLTVVKYVKTSKYFFFPAVEYLPTEVSLRDLILDGDTVDFGGSSQREVATMSITGNMEAAGHLESQSKLPGVNIEASGSFNRSSALEAMLESVSMDYTKLSRVIRASKFDDGHILIESLKNNPKIASLGVIYDVLKTKNPLSLTRSNETTSSSKFSIQEIGTADHSHKQEKTTKINLAPGTVLGFKVQEIPFDFRKVENKQLLSGYSLSHDGVRDFTEGCQTGNVSFSALKEKVEYAFENFRNLGREVKMMIWNPLSMILSCTETLHVLDRILEEGFRSAGDSSDLNNVPSELRQNLEELLSVVGLEPGVESTPPFLTPLGLLVSSLNEIDKEGVTLISTLDQEVRRQVLDTVEQILENVFEKTEGEAWSKLLRESNANKAKTVLEASGLILDEKNPYPALGNPGVPDMSLISLYVALKGLILLIIQ